MGTAFGILASVVLVVLAGALVLLPWERIPRFLHAISPIGGLAVTFALEVQFGLSVIRAFPFVLLLLMFLALYYTTVEFAIGAALGAADLILVTGVNPATGDPAAALLEGLLLVSLGILVRRVGPGAGGAPHRRGRGRGGEVRASDRPGASATRSCRS